MEWSVQGMSDPRLNITRSRLRDLKLFEKLAAQVSIGDLHIRPNVIDQPHLAFV
jgi:hypothetical protein